MKIKCSYCGYYFNDSDEKCPDCGGINEEIVRSVKNQPQTIAELKQWYIDRKLPSQETTRFFIGVDYKKPRAFGIYIEKSTGKIIVYKNKANGERVIRYEGTDEAYAVNELYMRLKQEIIEQKMEIAKRRNNIVSTPNTNGNIALKKKTKKSISQLGKLLIFGVTAVIAFFAFFSCLVR